MSASFNKKNMLHSVNTQSFYDSVAPTVRIDLASRLLEVKEGERLELRCEVTGYPPPAVQWHRQVAATHHLLYSGTDR
jgi:hypothetical protein